MEKRPNCLVCGRPFTPFKNGATDKVGGKCVGRPIPQNAADMAINRENIPWHDHDEEVDQNSAQLELKSHYYDIENHEKYPFAKKSKILNLGEDLPGSSREIRNFGREIDDLLSPKNKDFRYRFMEEYYKDIPNDEKDAVFLVLSIVKTEELHYLDDIKNGVDAFLNFYREKKDIGLSEAFAKYINGSSWNVRWLFNKFNLQLYHSSRRFFNGKALREALGTSSIHDSINQQIRSLSDEVKKDVLSGRASLISIFKKKKSNASYNKDQITPLEKKVRSSKIHVKKMISPDEASKIILGEIKLRGVQFGNSVNDKQRAEYISAIVEAAEEFSKITKRPKSDFSMGGKLGLSLGARYSNKKSSAHFDKKHTVISIKKGEAGAYIHELTHALEKNLQPSDVEKIRSIIKEDESGYMDRIKKILKDKGVGFNEYAYWTNPSEVLARCVEVEFQSRRESKEPNLNSMDMSSMEIYPTKEEASKILASVKGIFDFFL